MHFCLGHPELNPINGKAKQLPIFNPFDKHGRVFMLSWLSFMVSFMAWYAFPPLLTRTIRTDLSLTAIDVLNSNIVALCAGFIMRTIVGPLCDQFGPRKVMVGILVCSAIPCGLAGTITNVSGLYCIRFFVGLAGASFVPCQVWCTGFFDREVVGTANAFAAGWGNAGAGVTYFVMPAVFDSLVTQRGLTAHVAWRVAFIVPTILLLTCAGSAYFFCEDTPLGSWENRTAIGAPVTIVEHESGSDILSTEKEKREKMEATTVDVQEGGEEVQEKVVYEVVEKPTLRRALPLLLTPQTLMLALPYACSFGGELAINSILSSWYLQVAPSWGQTKAGQVAAIFGLLNIVTRPFGGFAADWIYATVPRRWGLTAKKCWYGFLVTMQGVFCLWIGLLAPSDPIVLVSGICAMAVFMDAANGAAFSLVPHVSPSINGILSGVVGGTGNLGGIFWSVGYRYTGSYPKGTWIVGVGSVAIGLLMMAVPPIPKAQRMAGGYMAQ